MRVVNPKRQEYHYTPITEYHGVSNSETTPEDRVFYLLKLPIQLIRSLRHYSEDLCYNCYNSSSLRSIENEYTKRCSICGYSSSSYVHTENNQGSTQIKHKVQRETSSNTYKRVNHMKYWLKRIQGKEKLNIDRCTLESIRDEVQQRHITHLDYDSMRSILKHLKLQSYYNNTYAIIRCISGETLVDLSYDQEKKLVDMFIQLQEPFYENHKEFTRVNMLGYAYIISKLCEILGWHDLAQCMPMMKSARKIHEQDIIWKRICETLHWPFIRTV